MESRKEMPYSGPAPQLLVRHTLPHQYIIEQIAKHGPSVVALKDERNGGKEIHYEDLYMSILKAEHDLFHTDILPRNIVCVCLSDGAAYLTYSLAAWRLGARLNPLDPTVTAEKLIQSIFLTKARWLIADLSMRRLFDSNSTKVIDNSVCVVELFKEADTDMWVVNMANWSDASLVVLGSKFNQASISAIEFTNLSVAYALQMIDDNLIYHKKPPGEPLRLINPFASVHGLLSVLVGLSNGYTVVLTACEDGEPENRGIRQQRGTIASGSIRTLSTLESDVPLDEWMKMLTVSDTPVVTRLVVPASVVTVYPVFESLAPPFVSLENPEAGSPVPILIAPNFECLVMENETDECEPDEFGEVWIRGPTCAANYIDGTPVADKRGWIHTGIIGKYCVKDQCMVFATIPAAI